MKTNKHTCKPLALRKALRLSVVIATLIGRCAQALTVLSGPSFAPAPNAPLAGVLTVATDVNSFVSVSVFYGSNTWERDFFDYGANHSETLLGFKPNRTNEITVTVRDEYRNAYTIGQSVPFVTTPLPTNMPGFILITNIPALMEPGYTLFRVAKGNNGAAYVTIVDYSGQVVWYGEASGVGGTIGPISTPNDVTQLANGDLFFPETDTSGLGEVNMLGQTVRIWPAPSDYPVDSHEALMTTHGTILYLSYGTEMIPNFPTSATDSNAPTKDSLVTIGRVVELSVTNAALLNAWSLIDILDPVRINYLCFLLPQDYGIDPEHANAIIDDTNDDSIIASLRNQDAIVKFSRAGQLQWILGPHDNWGADWQPYLLTSVGAPFAWNYAQHAPTLTPQGTLLFYDDGNCRAEPFAPPVPDPDNYSRAAEFSVDETNMEVSQLWEFSDTNSDRLYTGSLGNAPLLPQTGNVLVTFGNISYENGAPPSAVATNATMVRIKEVTHDPNPTVVFDLELFDTNVTNTNYGGYSAYRSYRIPDLYGHPAVPVADLTIQSPFGQPLLEFTADPALNYVVQFSADLVNWLDIGTPFSDDANGDFSFMDESGEGLGAGFYRVITQ